MTETSPHEETELIRRAAAGDSEAFGALVQPHLALFHNGIHRILGNTADTQDALQDALMSMHRDLPRFEGRSRFSSWGYKICLNAALMARRSRVRIQDMERSEPLGLGSFDERGHHLEPDHLPEWQVAAQAQHLVERREMRECLTRALDELPDLHRIVFVLKDLEDWETEDIARHLQITRGTVRQRLHRARVLLLARLRTFVLGGPS
jgi:RNA polymerase sigma-70 factor (ECF subfamily)